MEEGKLNELKRAKKVETIKPVKEDLPQAHERMQGTAKELDAEALAEVAALLRRVKQHVASAPTLAPKSLLDQFQFYDDGVEQRLYVHVNGTWRYITLT